MTACRSIGALMVGGRVVGQLKCELEAGHDGDQWLDPWSGPISAAAYAAHNRAGGPALERIGPTPHRVVLEWADAEPVDLDLFDPAEHFDVNVPIPETPPRWVLGDDAVPFESVPGRIMETPAPLNFPPTHLDRADLYGEE